MKILIIEDKYLLADAIEESLKQENFQTKIETPVIMLTAKSQINDKLQGLEHGADDYVTKPFHMRELIARIKIVLKRKSNIEDINTLECGNLKLNTNLGKMYTDDDEISINGKELDLLEILMLNQKQIVTRETIANKIWGYDSDAEYNNVEVYVSFLRKKLKIINANVKIKSVRGLGYKIELEEK